MPTSFEGHQYTRHLFKSVDNCENGGCYADIYTPPITSGKASPVALTFHGGGFNVGDTHHVFTDHFGYLLKNDFIVVSAEYRMAPHVRFEEIRTDLLAVYRWIQDELPAILGGRADGARIFVFGGSAGGTATVFVTSDAIKAGLRPPKALYIIYPMADRTLPIAGKPQISYEKNFPAFLAKELPEHQALVREYLAGPAGTGYDLKRQMREKLPPNGRTIWAAVASQNACLNDYLDPEKKHQPIDEINDRFPPTVLVKALADALLLPENTQMIHEKLTKLGVESKLIEAERMEHGHAEAPWEVWPQGVTWWEDVYQPALDFCITKCRA